MSKPKTPYFNMKMHINEALTELNARIKLLGPVRPPYRIEVLGNPVYDVREIFTEEDETHNRLASQLNLARACLERAFGALCDAQLEEENDSP